MAKPEVSWDKPHAIDPVDMAFPSRVVGTLLPPMEAIPEEFHYFNNTWCRMAARLFYQGGALPTVKEGVDAVAAKAHLVTVLGSFQPSHEHKMAGAGWLMSLWYELPAAA